MAAATESRESMIRLRVGKSRPAFDALHELDTRKRVTALSAPEFAQVVLERGIAAMIADLPPEQAAKVRKAAGAASSSR